MSEADVFLMKFCRKFVELYGKDKCAINMRHIQECIKDYSSVDSFWCLPLKGFLVPTTLITIIYLYNSPIGFRIIKYKVYAPYNWPSKYVDEYFPLIKRFEHNKIFHRHWLVDITPLPPIQEHAFLHWQLEELRKLQLHVTTDNYSILVLHHQAKELMVGTVCLELKVVSTPIPLLSLHDI